MAGTGEAISLILLLTDTPEVSVDDIIPLRVVAAPAIRVHEGLPAFLRLLAEPKRLLILSLLAHGERCVCDIEVGLGLPQNLVSHHLGVLKRAGILSDRRTGKWVYYRINSEAVAEQMDALRGLLDLRFANAPARACSEDE